MFTGSTRCYLIMCYFFFLMCFLLLFQKSFKTRVFKEKRAEETGGNQVSKIKNAVASLFYFVQKPTVVLSFCFLSPLIYRWYDVCLRDDIEDEQYLFDGVKLTEAEQRELR